MACNRFSLTAHGMSNEVEAEFVPTEKSESGDETEPVP